MAGRYPAGESSGGQPVRPEPGRGCGAGRGGGGGGAGAGLLKHPSRLQPAQTPPGTCTLLSLVSVVTHSHTNITHKKSRL